MHKKNNLLFLFALILGITLAVGASVWATSIGTNVSVSGTLTTDGASTLTGLATIPGGILANNSTSTIRNLDMLTSTSTSATSTYFAVSNYASTSALRVSNAATLDSTLSVTG